MVSLTHGLAILLLQVVGLLAGVWIAWRLLSSGRTGLPLRMIGAGVLGAVALVLAASTLDGGATTLDTARRSAVDARTGLETCVTEPGGNPQLLPYLNWLKARLPSHAVYALAPYSGQPDPSCLTLVLLPALPASLGEHPQWVVTFGTVPPDLKARIARHDPSVQVFAPGFALARGA